MNHSRRRRTKTSASHSVASSSLAMDLMIHDMVNTLLKVFLIAVLANGVNAQRTYTCLGGCFNQCFQRTSNAQPEGFSCYYPCLNRCNPNTPEDYQYYCQIGCSVKRCALVAYDGQRMENCFGKCTQICQTLTGGSRSVGGFQGQLPPFPVPPRF